MGQKSQPISLRLQKTNRSFESSWYSDYYYSDVLKREIESQFFINSILKQIQFSSSRFFIENFPKKSKITFFFLDPTLSRFRRSRTFRLSNRLPIPNHSLKQNRKGSSLQKRIPVSSSSRAPKNSFFRSLALWNEFQSNQIKSCGFKNTKLLALPQSLYPKREKHSSVQYPFTMMNQLYLPGSENFDEKNKNSFQSSKQPLSNMIRSTNSLNRNSQSISYQKSGSFINFSDNSTQNYRTRIQKMLSAQFQSHVSIYPIRTVSSFQSALFLAEEIVYYLEKRISFRKIKTSLFRELKYHPEIKGIRLCCSGRVGRIQRAKTDYVKHGQTPLNLFSSKMDFASLYGTTPFGLVGIKVWICFA